MRNRTGFTHTVARLYYEEGLSQTDIAQQLHVSSATVSRLLREARESGIVTIRVRAPSDTTNLSERLRGALGLQRVSIARDSPSTHLAVLTDPVGRILAEANPLPGTALAIGWGQTIWDILGVGLPSMPGILVVPASGGMQEPSAHFQTNELVRLAAMQTGGTARFIHAPYLPTSMLREQLASDPDVMAGMSLWESLEIVLVGIGLPYAVDRGRGGTSVTPRGPSAPDSASGDVLLHYFDMDGRPVPWRDETRLLAVTREQLMSAPLVVGAAAGAAKAPGIVGAARAKLIDALATDEATADAVLELLR